MTGEISRVLCGGVDDTFLEPTYGKVNLGIHEKTDANLLILHKTYRSRIEVVKRLILRFISLKLLANPNHEFAIILLAERAIWVK